MRLFSRSKTRAANNLGVIEVDLDAKVKKFRDPKLEVFDAYYENRQYDSKPDWDQAQDARGQALKPRDRQPRIKVAFAKTLAQRLTSKLVGQSVFPNFIVEDSPDDQLFFRAIAREAKLKSALLEPVRRMLNTGSILVRFFIVDGAYRIEWYHAKYCYPTFAPSGELQSVTIKYVYTDNDDVDSNGKPKQKWFRMDLAMDKETLFDNPEYEPDKEPEFTVVTEVVHNLGFVQAEWLRTAIINDQIDGPSLTEDLMSFIDEINYSLSQSSTAVSYNQDPQLAINGMNADEMDDLIRSSSKSWNLGFKGEAKFLESNLAGVERAIELRDKVRLNIQDISRIVLLDPEKIVGNAHSGKALEVLHGPLVDIVDELRLPIEDSIKNLILKIGMATLMADRQGLPVPIILPPNYMPKSLALELDWPPIFQQTMEDLQKKVQVGVAAHTGRAISKETLVKFLAKDFGVEDVQAEIAAIDAEPIINPFGGF